MDSPTTTTPMTDQNGDAVPQLALTPAAAAKALSISPRKLWALTADRSSGIPVIRWGRSVRFPVRELTEWVGRQVAKEGRQ